VTQLTHFSGTLKILGAATTTTTTTTTTTNTTTCTLIMNEFNH